MRGQVLLQDIPANGPLMVDAVDTPYAYDDELKESILTRGVGAVAMAV